IGIKDLNNVRWTFTRWGSRAVPHVPLPADDRTVGSLRCAGFVIVGKLATAEFGAMPVTEPDIHQPTRNPWSLAHSAGGSSGGSAAAVAAGMLPVAQGSDGAGSLRIPSAFCHLFTIKPSRGRVRNQFGLDDARVLYTSGPITRTVDDAAAMLSAMGPHGDSGLAAPRQRLARLRIRFVTSTPIGSTDPEIVDGLMRALSAVEGLGHIVEEGVLPGATVDEFLPLWQYHVARIPFVRWGRAQQVTRWLREGGRRLRRQEVAACHDALSARFTPPLATADIWAMPTVAVPPPRIGAFNGIPPADAFAAAARLGAFTAMVNVTGHPAVSVPIGLTRDGLPMGLQLVGQPGRDAELLAVSRELEEAMPWRHLRPPDSVE
ncbi:MAG TPA: amidase, partial [Vicinamibacterales bacterium]|nr:amidase [Vicinamibacterales bacterium]